MGHPGLFIPEDLICNMPYIVPSFYFLSSLLAYCFSANTQDIIDTKWIFAKWMIFKWTDLGIKWCLFENTRGISITSPLWDSENNSCVCEIFYYQIIWTRGILTVSQNFLHPQSPPVPRKSNSPGSRALKSREYITGTTFFLITNYWGHKTVQCNLQNSHGWKDESAMKCWGCVGVRLAWGQIL